MKWQRWLRTLHWTILEYVWFCSPKNHYFQCFYRQIDSEKLFLFLFLPPYLGWVALEKMCLDSSVIHFDQLQVSKLDLQNGSRRNCMWNCETLTVNNINPRRMKLTNTRFRHQIKEMDGNGLLFCFVSLYLCFCVFMLTCPRKKQIHSAP